MRKRERERDALIRSERKRIEKKFKGDDKKKDNELLCPKLFA